MHLIPLKMHGDIDQGRPPLVLYKSDTLQRFRELLTIKQNNQVSAKCLHLSKSDSFF